MIVGYFFSKGTNRVGISLTSPEDGDKSSLRNVVFSSYLEYRKTDRVQKLTHSERYKSSQKRRDSSLTYDYFSKVIEKFTFE
jgi:hypothetical protein